MSQSLFTGLMYEESWRMLTTDRSKAELFAGEQYFVRGLAAAHKVLHASPAGVLRRHAFLVIQPDCFAKRMAGRCLTFVLEHGFRPVHAVRVRVGQAAVEALWSLSSDPSTPDSDTIDSLVCGRSDSLLVVLRDAAPQPDVAASVRLTRLKGPARPERRTGGQLRTVLGAEGPPFVQVHTSDEPLDMIRESAIICESSIPELYAAMTGPVDPEARTRTAAQVEMLHRESETHDLDSVAATVRLREIVARIGRTAEGAPAARRLLSMLAAASAGEGFLDWQPFAKDLHSLGIDAHSWDAVLVGSRYVRRAVSAVAPGSGA